MALIPQFNICESSGCNSLSFSETTGVYSEDNPTGYGAPNVAIDDILTAVLTITIGSTSYDIDLFATGNFPTTDSDVIYTIDPTEIGYSSGDEIPDQIITFTYTLTTESATYSQVLVKALYCQVTCCVNTMFVELDYACDCAMDSINEALKAFAMLQGLKQAAGCANITNFNNILTQLNKLCANSECSACN